MKKKVLYGVTLALLGGASMVSLQSCKDDLSDLEHRVNYDETQNAQSLKELWDYCRDGANSLNDRVNALTAFMDGLNALDPNGNFANAFSNLRDQVNQIDSDLNGQGGIKDRLTAAEGEIDDINEALDKLLNETIPGINDEIEALQNDVKALSERVDAVESRIDALVDRFDNLITGIIIQRAFGPAFGDFSLPIGVQSNMLFNWYGENIANNDNFPNNDSDEAAGIDFSKFQAVPVDYNSVNLGDLYLTINPLGHNYDGTKFSLMASDGTVLPFELTVDPSTDKLMFGSRADVNASALYKANLTVDASKIDPIKVTLDEEKLKSAVKNAANDPSLLTATKLVKAVYDQLSIQVPAYAVRYDWTAPTGNVTVTKDDEGNVTEIAKNTADYSVISEYKLAVATARPLSYNALKGISSSKQLPTGHLANFLEKLQEKALEKINVDASIDVKGYTVKVGSIYFDGNANNGTLIATVNNMTVNGKPVTYPKLPGNIQLIGEGTFTVACNDVDTAVETLNDAIVEVLCFSAQRDDDAFRAEAELKLDAVLLEMNNQINDIVDQIKGNIGNAFDSIENSNYFAQANRVFNFYNRVASKINNFLANPNAYLQVAAFYETNDDLGILSQVASDPTPFTGNGKYINVYLSSYTGEFLAPAAKKFFACTSDLSVNEGSEVLGKVVDGSVTEVSIPVEKLQQGKVYEFVYQGLDYSGYTSTKKFYIEVK